MNTAPRCVMRLLLAIALLGAASAARELAAAAPKTLQGTLQTLTGQSGASHYQQWFLHTSDGQRWTLEFEGDTEAPAGSQVEVAIHQQLDQNWLLLAGPPKLVAINHARSLLQATNTAPKGAITMVVFIMDLSPCRTAAAATTPQQVRQFLGTTQPISMAGMFDYCSQGQVRLDVTNSLVINVPFPCSGTAPDGTRFTTNTCTNNLVPWQQFAEQYATRQGYNLGRYHHRVIILPKAFKSIMSGCGFDSLASQGPWIRGLSNGWGAGYVWICGDCWNWAPTWWHELGHNFGVNHARNEYGPAPWSGNYGDYMSGMGAFGGTDARCYDAAQLWTTGWSTPAATIDINSLAPGAAARMVNIPMQRRGPTGLKVTVSSSPIKTFAFSYRGTTAPYDKPFQGVSLGTSQAVAVHRAPSGVATTDTALVGMLTAAGRSFSDAASRLSVTLVSMNGNIATVAVCRQTAPGVACYPARG